MRKSNRNPFCLTPQEFKVMELIAQGYSNPQIEQELFIAHSTLATHIGNIYAKLGFVDNTEKYTSTLRVRAVLKWQQYKKECENGRK